jgi:hypothetical protein
MKILLLIIIMVVAVTAYASAESSIVETVTTFNPDAFELPEGLAVSRHGDLYVGLLGGEIKKVTPDGQVSSFATLDPGEGFLLGLAFDQQNALYAALASFNPETHGVWEIKEDRTAQAICCSGPTGAA